MAECMLVSKDENLLPSEEFDNNLESSKRFSTPPPVIFAGSPSTRISTAYHTQSRSGKSHYSLNRLTPLHYSHITGNNMESPGTDKFDDSAYFSVEHMGTLRHQVKQLEAALEHSTSRQRLLEVSLNELKSELTEKKSLLTNKQLLLEAIEEEHRKVKANFRELLDETLITKKRVSAEENMDDDIQYFKNNSDLCGTEPLIENAGPTSSSISSTIDKTISSESLHENEIKKKQFYYDQQSQELVESLRETMDYAQSVLQRNTLLEEKCNQLETSSGERMKELYEELEFVRQQRVEAETKFSECLRNLELTKAELVELHNELSVLHQKLRSTQCSDAKLYESKEEIEKLKNTINTLELEKSCIEEELGTHKQLLISERESHRSLMDSARATLSSDSLSSRVVELEETVKTERITSEEKIKVLETELSTVRHESQQINLKLGAQLRNTYEKEEEINRLTAKNEKLTNELETITKQYEQVQDKLNEFERINSELNKTKSLLEEEREKSRDQSAALQKQLELVRESNQRFVELSEKHASLDLLLKQQEEQREKILREKIQTSDNLHEKIDYYRQQWESLRDELYETKKELAKSTEVLKVKEQEFQVEKLRELRQIKHDNANEQRSLLKRFESDMMRLRAEHEEDLTELRKQRQEKLDNMAAHYESVIQEMKIMYDKKVLDLITEKKMDVEERKKEFHLALTELRTGLQDQLQHERELHEKELDSLATTYQENLQNHLKKKTQELSEVKHQFDLFKQNAEQEQLLHKNQLDDLKQQLRILKSRDSVILTPRQSEDQNNVEVTLKLKEELEALRQEYDELKDKQEAKQRETLDTAERKIQLIQHKYEVTQKDNEATIDKLNKKNEEIKMLQEDHKKQLEVLQAEKQKLVDDLEVLKERSETKLFTTAHAEEDFDQELLSSSYQTDRIETLTVKLQEMQEASLEMKKRMEIEAELHKAQMEEKDQRLAVLQATNEHVNQVLQRNSELEQEFSEYKQKTQNIIELKTKQLRNNEDELFKSVKSLDELSKTNSALQSTCKDLEMEIEDSNKQASSYKKQLEELIELQSKVSELTDETLDLRKQLSIYQKQRSGDVNNTISTKQLESLRQLNDQLVASRNEVSSLHEELELCRSQLMEKSEASIEVVSLKSKVQSQEKLIEFLQQKLATHESLIKELTLNENEREKTNSAEARLTTGSNADMLHEFSKRIEDLSKQCFDLTEQKLTYEQERRTLLHRMELEKQVASQSIEQKDRQLRQLMETNKRAEKLFARNAEVEQLLLSLTRQLDQLQQQKNAYPEASNVKNSIVSCSQEDQFLRSTEIETLRNLLLEREEYIQQLNTRLRDLQSLHTREVDELNNKLRSTMLELQLSSTENDSDVLKLLVEKTAELQREVARLHRERDASYELIQAEKEALKDIVSSSARSITKNKLNISEAQSQDANSLLMEISILQQRIEQLLEDRVALQQQVQSLLKESECFTKTEETRSDVIELENKNANLQKTIRALLKRLREHKSTLNFVVEHANRAVQQNIHLDELGERLHLETEDRQLLNSLHEKTIELRTVLNTVNSWVCSSSSSSAVDSSQQRYKEDGQNPVTGLTSVVNSVQNNLRRVWSRVSVFSQDEGKNNKPSNHVIAESVTTPNQRGHFTPSTKYINESSPITTDHSLLACNSDVPTNVLFESSVKLAEEDFWKGTATMGPQIQGGKERKAKRPRLETAEHNRKSFFFMFNDKVEFFRN